MPKAPEENANKDRVEEEDLDDQDEDTDEDADESDEDDEHDEDESEDSDDDKSDDDDDDDKPITKKDLAKAIADAMSQRGKNKAGARQRLAKNGNTSKGHTEKPNPRLDALEASIRKGEESEAKRQYGFENGLTPGEVDVVYRFSKKPTSKTLKDPIVKGALDGYRNSSKRRDNLPSNSGRAFKPGGKDWNSITDPKERQKHFGDRRRSLLESKKNR